MICSRRLYKGNSYDICLPLTDSGVTLVRFYTQGDVIIEKEPEISGDSMCFELTADDLAVLPDGVLRYEADDKDTNSPYVIVTPGDYSGSTLDDLLEDAFDSGYTAGQEDCSGGSCEHVWEEGYDSGYTDGSESVDCTPYYDSGYTDGRDSVDCSPFYDSGVTDGYRSGYTSGHTDGFEEGYASGTTDGWQPAYDSGFTDGVNSVECSGYTQDLIANLQGDYFVIPEGTARLREYALANISGLTSITIPNSVWEIGYRAFYDDRYLQSVTLGSGLQIIGQGAFHFCHRLTGITIPASVESIENNAFHYCSGLTYMTFEGLTPPNIYANALGSTAYTFPIYVPCESVEAYKSAAPDYASRITCQSGQTPVIASSLTWYGVDNCGGREEHGLDIDSLNIPFPTYIEAIPSGAVLDMVYVSSDPSVISIDASGNVIGHQSWTPVTLSATDLNSNITVTMDELEATPTPYTVNRALSDCPCGVALDGSYDSTSCSCVPVSGGTYHQELDFVAPSWANSTEIRMVSKPSWVSYVTPSAWTKCVSGEVQNIEFTVDECYDASPLSGDYRHGEIVFQENGVSAMTNQIDIYQYKPE